MNRPYEREQAVAIRAVREAARLCRAVGAEISPEVLAKKDKSPVTVADFGSQALICRTLAQAFPDDPVIAEEDSVELRQPGNAAILDQVLRHVRAVRAESESESERASGSVPGIDAGAVCRWIDHGETSAYRQRIWTLDPIDGTKGFLRGEQYAVALALIVDRQVAVAALACPHLVVRGAWCVAREEDTMTHDPMRVAEPGGRQDDPSHHAPRTTHHEKGAVFFAIRGQGAFVVADEFGPPASKKDASAAPMPVCVSDRDDPAAVRFCESVESGHSAHGDAAAVAARLGMTVPPLRMDSQAKYAVVARGEAEIYLRLPTRADYREKIWDHAAGALIVAEAGGTVTDIDGKPLEFHHGRELAVNRGVIVTNGRLHRRVIEALREIGLTHDEG
jgi:3'(2'), 5'-bisphosphate nucleotidase